MTRNNFRYKYRDYPKNLRFTHVFIDSVNLR